MLLVQTPTIHHELWALDTNNLGAKKFSVNIDPTGGNPALDPTQQGQRGALALSGGHIYIPFGGLPHDCGTYRGWVLSASATNGVISNTFQADPKGATGQVVASGPPVVQRSTPQATSSSRQATAPSLRAL